MSAQPSLFPMPPAAPLPTDPDAGPRQTVERLRHPTLGEVVAVFENGPAYLRTADGARHNVRRIGPRGGSASQDEKTSRSWRRVQHADGSVVEADQLTHGASHRRTWSPLLGIGWMVWLPNSFAMRWEGDDGRVIALDVVTIQIGDAAYIAASNAADRSRARNKKWPELTDAAREWMRVTMRDGTSMDFRRGSAPSAADANEVPRG